MQTKLSRARETQKKNTSGISKSQY